MHTGGMHARWLGDEGSWTGGMTGSITVGRWTSTDHDHDGGHHRVASGHVIDMTDDMVMTLPTHGHPGINEDDRWQQDKH